ncbi:MAG: hypothetical protein A2086_13765 [Spirochaetes bacterium GWD1_27_9]|nr:MAG: hypothetical protein A2Z98_03365 [Spirochaetes bacterium GWB1_27_13]OHD23360.1 MAG: hypothetical protein A2Y34_04150 [Spirochaetes bacterium GWC1_27_15]OHD36417.1 MAG: hypothetical protein A2086_13765 [Spirochaetes bacterium GWD1_27_9]
MKKIFILFLIVIGFSLCFSEDNKKSRIAILDFKAIGIDATLASGIQENLSSSIIDQNTFIVVERSQLNKVMQELNLAGADEFNEESAAKIGNLLGVEFVLLGSVTKIGVNITINVRAIEVKTGLAAFAKKVTTKSETELVDAIDNLASLISTKGKRDAVVEATTTTTTTTTTTIPQKDTTKPTKLSNLKIAGIALVTTGSIFFVGGLTLFILDNTVFGTNYVFAKDITHAQFIQRQTFYQMLFGVGIGVMALGGVLAIVSIPLFVIKEKKMSLEIGVGQSISCGFNIKL